MGVPKKYMWVPVSFDEEIKKIQKKIAEKNHLKIETSDIVFQLGEDINMGRISIKIPILRFNRVPSMRIGNEIKELKKKR